MTMKRSFDSSFVTENSNDYAPTRSRSLHRRTATLATHPFYIPEDVQSHGYFYEQPLLTPSRFILDEYERDSDFQSNVWFQPTSGGTQFWNCITPARRPLTGLGITFGSPEAPTATSSLLASPPVLAPFLRSSAPSPQVAPIVAPDNLISTPGSSARPIQSAYSDCPSADFVMYSPLAAPTISSYSPTDDFLMLVDSSPAAGSSIDEGKGKEVMPDVDISLLSMDSPKSPVIGLFADVNYRTLAARKSPVLGVNPQDITSERSGPMTVSPQAEDGDVDLLVGDIEPLPSPAVGAGPKMEADFPEEALSVIFSILADSVNQGQPATCQLPVNAAFRRVPPPGFGLSMQPPTFASRTTLGSGVASASAIGRPLLLPVRSPLVPVQPRNLADQSPGPVQRPDPVLNAHEGIDLEILRSRAEAFRRLNPGCELDKTFLQTFAGRLSERGELLPEFRCYVKGCCQTNKRRDHILVHVGSHVEHRPFQCDEWYVPVSQFFPGSPVYLRLAG